MQTWQQSFRELNITPQDGTKERDWLDAITGVWLPLVLELCDLTEGQVREAQNDWHRNL